MSSYSQQTELRNRTKQFGLRIVKLYRALPKSTEAQVIGHQLLRSGLSIGAHYREACRARSDAELISKFGVLLQELDESNYWIEILSECEIMKSAKLSALIRDAKQMLAIFTKAISTTRNRSKKD